MLIHRNASLPTSRWPNGAGRKADLAKGEGWLIGFAWLDADAPFSQLPGMARTITLVDGPGFTLDIEGHPLPVLTRFVPADFDGGAATQCRIAGPSRVLNVMTDRAGLSHDVKIATMSIELDPSTAGACFVVLLAGSASVDEAGATASLGLLDAAELHAPAAVRVGGDGCVAICRVFGAAPQSGSTNSSTALSSSRSVAPG